jgi:hypothetical protein
MSEICHHSSLSLVWMKSSRENHPTMNKKIFSCFDSVSQQREPKKETNMPVLAHLYLRSASITTHTQHFPQWDYSHRNTRISDEILV